MPAAESSKEMCTPPPVDPGDCGNGESTIAGEGVNAGKGETSSAAVAVSSQIADGWLFSFSTLNDWRHFFVI